MRDLPPAANICMAIVLKVRFKYPEQFICGCTELARICWRQGGGKPFGWPRIQVLSIYRKTSPRCFKSDGTSATERIRDEKVFAAEFCFGRIKNRTGEAMRSPSPPAIERNDRRVSRPISLLAYHLPVKASPVYAVHKCHNGASGQVRILTVTCAFSKGPCHGIHISPSEQ